MKNLICKNCGSGDLSVDGNITVCNSCGARFDNNEEGKAQTNSGVSQKICPFCGSRLNADELFCSNCGAKYIEFNRETETDNSAGQDRRQQNTPNYSSGAVNQFYDEALIKHKYSLIKFRRNLAIFMIISTIGAMITGFAVIPHIVKAFTTAANYADSMSVIQSVGGNTIAEAFYQDFGYFLGGEVTVEYMTACLISGFYQTFLFFSLFGWIYLCKKASFQKNYFERTGKFC